MLKVRKRLISALCAFVVGASSDLVALPRFNCLASAGLFGYSDSSGSFSAEKPDGPVMSLIKGVAPSALGIGSTALVGDTVVLKVVEYIFKRYGITAICWLRNPSYRVLLKKFNLLQKANEVVELGKKVTLIGYGLRKISKYFCDNEGRLIEKDENGAEIKNFSGFSYFVGESKIEKKLKFDVDVAVVLCHLLSVGYSCENSKNLRDDDVFDRTIELIRRVFMPFGTPREGFCFEFDKNTEKYLHLVEGMNELEASDDVRSFVLASDTRWKIEGYFHGYEKPVAYPFNVCLVKKFFASNLSVKKNDSNAVRDFLDKFDDVRSKDVEISEDNAKRCSCRISGNSLLLDIGAKVGGTEGKLGIKYTIPDGKGNVDVAGLFSIKFIKND